MGGFMANFTVRNIPSNVYETLKKDARRLGRSLNAEFLDMARDRAEATRRRRQATKAMRELDRMREGLARKYPNAPESVEIIREIRDTR
jgi:plasmid stability protein